jgi:NAD(P)-dependent dehydrogenase (short-subunit alcohol dehydrogenase family)
VTFAKEFAADNIRVNALAPGMVPTESACKEYTDEDFEYVVRREQLIGRQLTTDDMTRVLIFLLSDDAASITGETIRATGGGWLSI